MRVTWVVLACSIVVGCGGDEGSTGSGSSAACGIHTTGLSGEGPGCSNSLECGDDTYELACDAMTSMCDCTKNGAVAQTINYDDSFCPADFGNADFDAHQAAARAACGWP